MHFYPYSFLPRTALINSEMKAFANDLAEKEAIYLEEKEKMRALIEELQSIIDQQRKRIEELESVKQQQDIVIQSQTEQLKSKVCRYNSYASFSFMDLFYLTGERILKTCVLNNYRIIGITLVVLGKIDILTNRSKCKIKGKLEAYFE